MLWKPLWHTLPFDLQNISSSRELKTKVFLFAFFFPHCSRVAKDHDGSPEHVGNYSQRGDYPRLQDVRGSRWRLRRGAGSPGWPQGQLREGCGGDTGPQARTSQRKGENWRPWGQVSVSVLFTSVLISGCYLCLSDSARLKLAWFREGQASWWISWSIYIPSLSMLPPQFGNVL